jgi:hypothetical protein
VAIQVLSKRVSREASREPRRWLFFVRADADAQKGGAHRRHPCLVSRYCAPDSGADLSFA